MTLEPSPAGLGATSSAATGVADPDSATDPATGRAAGSAEGRPDGPGGPRDGSSRRTRWLVGAVLFAAAVILPLLRQRGIPFWRTVYAEDGWVYLGEVDKTGYTSVWKSYNGYLQLLPRVLTLPTMYLPITRMGQYFSFVAALWSAVVAWLAYRCTKGWVASVPLRLLVALTVVLAGSLGYEVTGTLANTIWPAFAVLPWAIVALTESRRDVVFRSAFVFAAAASTALTVVFVPLALVFLVWRRTKAAAIVVGCYFAGVLAQVWSITHSEFVTAPPVNSFKGLVEIYSVRVAGGYVFGEGTLPFLYEHLGKAVGALATVILVAALAVSFFRAQRRNAALAVGFLLMAGATFVVPVWLRGTNLLELGEQYGEPASRYVGAPVLLILSAFCLLLDSPDPSRDRAIAKVGRVVLIVQTIVVMVLAFPVSGGRGDGPTWIEGLGTARTQCVAQGNAGELDVAIAPPPQWHVTLTCARINDD